MRIKWKIIKGTTFCQPRKTVNNFCTVYYHLFSHAHNGKVKRFYFKYKINHLNISLVKQ